jgi:hypothetical protein
MKQTLLIPLLFACAMACLLASDDAPWLKERSMSDFQILLNRSPFSLPTAEESAPMAERFFLTGSATINEEPVVFVMDRNTQKRDMLAKQPNKDGNVLLEFLPDPDPKKMKATVQIEGQTTTIQYSEVPGSEQSAPQSIPPPQQPQPAQLGGNPAQLGVNPAQLQNQNPQPPRRVIRRRVISGQPPTAQPNPGQ